MQSPDRRAAERIRGLRLRRRWTTSALAERVTALGKPMSSVVVSNIELGRTRVRVNDVWLFAAALDVSPWLLLATHPIDEDLALADTKLGVSDAMSWEAGAAAVDTEGHTFALEAAQAFGQGLLPQLREAREAVLLASSLRTRASQNDDEIWRQAERREEEEVEAELDEWAARTAQTWRSWLNRRDDGLQDAIAERLSQDRESVNKLAESVTSLVAAVRNRRLAELRLDAQQAKEHEAEAEERRREALDDPQPILRIFTDDTPEARAASEASRAEFREWKRRQVGRDLARRARRAKAAWESAQAEYEAWVSGDAEDTAST